MRKKLNKQAMRSLAWALLESVTVVAGNVTAALILARFLDSGEFGAAAAALAIVTIVDLMVTAPFSDTLVQRHRIDMLHLDSAFWAMIVAGVLGSLLCGLLAYPLSLVYQEPALAPLIGVYGLTCLVSGVSGVPKHRTDPEASDQTAGPSDRGGAASQCRIDDCPRGRRIRCLEYCVRHPRWKYGLRSGHVVLPHAQTEVSMLNPSSAGTDRVRNVDDY
jgi:hypothetical protein